MSYTFRDEQAEYTYVNAVDILEPSPLMHDIFDCHTSGGKDTTQFGDTARAITDCSGEPK